jgi:hypothetical protein
MAIGNSLFDEEGAKIVEDLYTKAAEKNVQIHLPSGRTRDYVTNRPFANGRTRLMVYSVLCSSFGNSMAISLAENGSKILRFTPGANHTTFEKSFFRQKFFSVLKTH